MKTCVVCQSTLPFDSFYKDASRTGGYRHECKECVKAQRRASRAADPEHFRAYDRARVAANPEHQRAISRKSRLKHRDRINERMRVDRQQHPEKYRQYRYNVIMKDRDRYLGWKRDWYRRMSPDTRARVYLQKGEKRRTDTHRAWERPYRRRRYHTIPAVRISRDASARVAQIRRPKVLIVERVLLSVLLERDRWMCGLCHKKVTLKTASIDHIIPISDGGEHSYKNTQIAHRSCNSKKGNRRTIPSQLRLLS